MLYGYDEDMPATPMDSVREWVSVVGADRPDVAWLCHDYDVWVANPYYNGPPVRHPEDYDYDDEAEMFVQDMEAMESGDFYAAVPNENGEFEDDCPF